MWHLRPMWCFLFAGLLRVRVILPQVKLQQPQWGYLDVHQWSHRHRFELQSVGFPSMERKIGYGGSCRSPLSGWSSPSPLLCSIIGIFPLPQFYLPPLTSGAPTCSGRHRPLSDGGRLVPSLPPARWSFTVPQCNSVHGCPASCSWPRIGPLLWLLCLSYIHTICSLSCLITVPCDYHIRNPLECILILLIV